MTVYAPCLPGHGTVPEALIEVTNERFIDASEKAFSLLAEKYDRVHIVGLSLGGVLATLLAAGHAGEAVLGCVSLLSPGYALNKTLAARVGLDGGTSLSEYVGKMIPLPQRKPLNDAMDECIFGYNAVPFISFDRLQGLNSAARATRIAVTAPVMLLYAEADAVVDAEASAEAAGIFPRLEEALCFQESEHNLLLGCDRDETVSRCTSFIRRHRI